MRAGCFLALGIQQGIYLSPPMMELQLIWAISLYFNSSIKIDGSSSWWCVTDRERESCLAVQDETPLC